MNPVVHLTVSTKLSRCLIVLALLCLVGETPVRLYGHLNWIESMQLDASESDLLAVLELALGQVPVLSHVSSPSCFKPSNWTPFTDFPLIIGTASIPLVGRSLGGCGN